ncbi:hypothetical protein KFK09_012356 [Dendrobium nobile]|uniref:Late embryogenesis abundant protein LEA-2 subgroup domain-containing protein n=1 Tax=Dendrobium nobile TaxID=94219 RepID=A0A8T3BH62_DENNO|nr:hypothetical protein KFK09_012356 [Dendrobium nobile]
MADQVPPVPSPPSPSPSPSPSLPPQGEKLGMPPADPMLKPSPPSASFVIQLPKDQIYRIPPPENAYRFNFYTRQAAKRQRGSCSRCLFFLFIVLSLIFIFLAAALGIIYLIFLPKLPSFSIDSLSIHNINLSSSAAASPEVDLTIRSANTNKKIGIYYRDGGSVVIDYSGEVLSRGAWPSFYQGKRNVTVVQTALRGSGIRFADDLRGSLTAAVKRREVPLGINAELPMRMRFGAVKIWTITVKLQCDVTVNKLTADARILNELCRAKVDVL